MPGKTIAVDMDEVLVNISQHWARKAQLHPELSDFPTIAALPRQRAELGAAIRGRDVHYLQHWLALPAHLTPAFDSLYRDDPAFYDALLPTPFCEGVRKAMAMQGMVDAVHVITHTMGDHDPVNTSKRRWLARWLPGATVHLLDGKLKKSDVIRQHCPEPDTFADDSMKNVIDVLTAAGVRAKEITIPKLGCNSPLPEQVAIAAKLNRTEINYYAIVHGPHEDVCDGVK